VKLLLDTHVLIWLAEGIEDLPDSSRDLIDRAAASSGLAVSAISFWEVAMLVRRGRIALATPIEIWRGNALATPSVIEAPLDGQIAIEAVELPGALHQDPADRLIVATARVQGWRLATRDRRLIEYGQAGHVQVLPV
jgi:PIN domain nuclease of toxin-antitoxin system